jgi:hypothetical protein
MMRKSKVRAHYCELMEFANHNEALQRAQLQARVAGPHTRVYLMNGGKEYTVMLYFSCVPFVTRRWGRTYELVG